MCVENLPDFCGEVCEVAGIEPDTISVRIVIVNAVFLERPYRIEHAASEGVVCVNEKNQVFAPVCVYIVAEGLVFALYRASV